MRFTNVTGLKSGWTVAYEANGREMLVIVVKATYAIPEPGQESQLMPEQVALVGPDRFSGDPGTTAPLFETDYAHRKPDCDVLLVGNAHAPRGESTQQVEVSLQVGPMIKQFRVIGQRVWFKSGMGIAVSSAQPFTVMPISYDVAFGGTDRTREEEGRVDTFLANPVGRGYWRDHSRIDAQPLPNTEQSNRVVDDPTGNFVPMAFSPLGRNWLPRVRYAGTYDEHWVENEAPFWPQDFDPRYFQAAAADQIIPYPAGGEEVVMRNLTPDGHRAFRLPTRAVPVTFIPYKGRDVTLEANIDTIVLEPEAGRFTMTWRANLALGKSVFDVKETIAGEKSAAWHRARRFPGKTYYPSLAEAVQARPRRRGS